MEGICRDLASKGWPTLTLSATMPQEERLATLASLQNHRCRVLLTTDLASRGVDGEQVDVVINMDLPYDSETFLHRIGRAGRFGSKGIAITIANHGDELSKFQNLLYDIGGPEFKISLLPNDLSSDIWSGNYNFEYVCSTKRPDNLEANSKTEENGIKSQVFEIEDKPDKESNEFQTVLNVQEKQLFDDLTCSILRKVFKKSMPSPPFTSYSDLKSSYENYKTTSVLKPNDSHATERENSQNSNDELLKALESWRLNVTKDELNDLTELECVKENITVNTSCDKVLTDDAVLLDCRSGSINGCTTCEGVIKEVGTANVNGTTHGYSSQSSSSQRSDCSSSYFHSSNSLSQSSSGDEFKDVDVESEKSFSSVSSDNVNSVGDDTDYVSDSDDSYAKGQKNKDCKTCVTWFESWREELMIHRRTRQRQIYIQQMLK